MVLLFIIGCAKNDTAPTPAPILVVPTSTTAAVISIVQTTAQSGGSVTSDGGASVTARGVCWSTTTNPTITNSKTSDGTGTGSFTNSLTGLTANTLYYVRAYATNSVGTAYGSEITFTTLPQPINDNKSGGIYKGAIVGSAGNFTIVLQDAVNKIYVTMDGTNYTLTTQTTITSGNAIVGVVFTGTTGIQMTISVNADGNNPSVDALTIPGHPGALAILLKETSTTPVMVFQGRYTKSGGSSNDHCTGTLLIALNGSYFIAAYREDVLSNPTSAGSFAGSYTGNQINTTVGTSIVALTISSNKQSITGTLTDVCPSTVSCTRSL